MFSSLQSILVLCVGLVTALTPTALPKRAVDDTVAALYSMSAASLASLPLPTTTIAAAPAAQTYIENNWAHVAGDSSYISFVTDPYDTSNKEKVLRVSYPNGTYANSPAGEGGVGMYLNPFGNVNAQRAMFTYEVAFSKGWDFVKGGKLLGLFGGEVGQHCSGGIYTNTCFSTRSEHPYPFPTFRYTPDRARTVVWRADGDAEGSINLNPPEVYAYIPGYTGFDTKTDIISSPSAYGYSINRGSWKFTVGGWQKISLVVVLNSNPNTDSEPANGGISIYLDDVHVFTHNYFVFRNAAAVDVSSIFFSTFFGGSSEDYASKGGYAYFRNMKSYYSTAASTTSGTNVTATYPS
ncbi:hypothetical protein DXG01_001411 [Tephrocybe rancida]|nr:hypothetical protein DXG01_001411 [Tephrocybe rancida]